MPLILGDIFPKACGWLPKPHDYLVQLMFTVFSVLVLLESIYEDRLWQGKVTTSTTALLISPGYKSLFRAIFRSIENCDKTKDIPEPKQYLTAPHLPTLILSKK
ncbi:hypothetical protein DL95DRAFT_410233 [Leptodontidium sp. 2 PMI_412]|nr:hypothetical protein DL95DRAFT_410233 [Leptodontidium sp. 2 PMI_412]